MSDFLADIAEGLVVRPGDTLILRAEPGLSATELQRISETTIPLLRERIPGVDVIVVGGSVEQIAVRRAEHH